MGDTVVSSVWARSGAMWVTGRAGGPPLACDGAPAEQVTDDLRRLAAIGTLAPGVASERLPDVRLLGERAAMMGLVRQGPSSAGGACRLLPADDGWVAVSLPRPTDLETLPALIEGVVEEPWADLARWVASAPAHAVVARATLLGVAAAAVPAAPQAPRRPSVVRTVGGSRARGRRPRVLDLSSLWAGPLCAHLLGLMGADVLKVESSDRPDGARDGEPRFYDVLHAGHRAVALGLSTASGRDGLRRLIDRADVVIEASRPRALRQLGVDAERAVEAGVVWASVTAYGRGADDELRTGFGDDVAAGAGLVARDRGGPVPAGDALADPVTGVRAALAVAEALGRPAGCLLDISMHDTAREAANRPPELQTRMGVLDVLRPVARTPTGRAPALGEHTAQVLERGWW